MEGASAVSGSAAFRRGCCWSARPTESCAAGHDASSLPVFHLVLRLFSPIPSSVDADCGLMRAPLDRKSPLYKVIYTQRTSCERINSQAKELGIERTKVRNQCSVARLNTLTSVMINVRALCQAKSINRGLQPIN